MSNRLGKLFTVRNLIIILFVIVALSNPIIIFLTILAFVGFMLFSGINTKRDNNFNDRDNNFNDRVNNFNDRVNYT